MSLQGVPIGVASALSGVRVPTIRYYEQIGLLPKPLRAQNNRRLYGTADLHRLTFIRRARELGFDIEAIRTLLTLQDEPDQSCGAADAIARARLAEIERRINSLTRLKTELERMITACSLGQIADCRVIGALAGRIDDSGEYGRNASARPAAHPILTHRGHGHALPMPAPSRVRSPARRRARRARPS